MNNQPEPSLLSGQQGAPAHGNVPSGRRSWKLIVVLVFVAVLVAVVLVVYLEAHRQTGGGSGKLASSSNLTAPLTADERQSLRQLAQKTWNFYSADLDTNTSLPRNFIVPSDTALSGNYTSGTDIGFYLDSIVAARDLSIITATQANRAAAALLTTLEKLPNYQGFPYRWYGTATAQPISGPSGQPLADEGPTTTVTGRGFISSVDDAWYAQSLVIARQAFPALANRFSTLLNAMNWQMLLNPSNDQMYIGYMVGKGPTKDTYNLLYGGTRIVSYMAIGSKIVPGAVWWAMARTPTVKAHSQSPAGSRKSYTDPQTGQVVSVFEGHYSYNGQDFVPTWAGSMFQALAPALVVPEQTWSPEGLGANDLITAELQRSYALNALGYKIWGLAPASTPGSLNGYRQYGAPGLAVKKGKIPDDGITPYADFLTLNFIPQAAYANYQSMLSNYPGLGSGPYGLYDAIEPNNGTVAERYMDVSQGAILMGLDDALTNGRLQNYFAADPVGQAVKPYVALEKFNLN